MNQRRLPFTRTRRLHRVALGAALSVVVTGAGCAGGVASEVSPDEIPVLEARLTEAPNDGDLVLRYSAALFAAGQCDSAMAVARRGMMLEPDKALGPLVVGQCLEGSEAYDEAVGVYEAYLAAYPEHRGSGAVRARQHVARRQRAVVTARRALAQEADLAQVPADPTTVAVLPVAIVGDPEYEPLSRGLAEIMTTDLALLERFRMVERLQVGALLDEMQLAETGRVDGGTAARVGHMLRAGRMVQGVATIPPDGGTRLEASVVLSTGEVQQATSQEGDVKDLLRMEKQVVVDVAAQMGYVLSEAELRTILENGTQNLAAFLAYSNGLEAEDLGNYEAAAAFFGQAVRSDPNFRAARTSYQSASASTTTTQASAGAVTTVATTPPAPTDVLVETGTLGDPLSSAIVDVAATDAETTAPTTPVQSGTTTSASQPPSTVTVVGTPPPVGVVRIFFLLP
jgi:tetratricopeptide (TPR) repeat protein